MALVSEIFTPFALGVFISFAIAFCLLTFVIKRLERSEKSVTMVSALRNFILPILAFHLIFRSMDALHEDHISVRITETILSIATLYLLISAINYLFFSANNIFNRQSVLPKLGRDVLTVGLTLILGAVVLSSVWGINVGSLFAALGVGSLVIGLALQEPLSNLFHGISMLMARPFQRHDWIEIGEETGRVVDFTWRSVKILNRDNELVIIPNSSIAKLHIKNFSRPTSIHAENITIGFSYNDNPKSVKESLRELAIQTEGILDEPIPVPRTLSYDDFSITYGLKFFIKDYEEKIIITDRLMTSIFEMAQAKGYEIPFPIRDIRMSSHELKKSE